tara:strand:+ start:84 stop:617 length:534 start_codon:yes stop_codon:yes gene_type:complete
LRVLGLLTLSFLALLVIVKMLTVLETRSQDIQYRNNNKRIQELAEDLDTSRRKYLIAVKAEGVSKHKLSQLKTRWASLKQNLEQIQITSAQREQRREKELALTLEKAVMEALGGPTARRDSHFKHVMKAISQLIDLDKQNNSEDLITTVQEKLAEMAENGTLDASPLSQAREATNES